MLIQQQNDFSKRKEDLCNIGNIAETQKQQERIRVKQLQSRHIEQSLQSYLKINKLPNLDQHQPNQPTFFRKSENFNNLTNLYFSEDSEQAIQEEDGLSRSLKQRLFKELFTKQGKKYEPTKYSDRFYPQGRAEAKIANQFLDNYEKLHEKLSNRRPKNNEKQDQKIKINSKLILKNRQKSNKKDSIKNIKAQKQLISLNRLVKITKLQQKNKIRVIKLSARKANKKKITPKINLYINRDKQSTQNKNKQQLKSHKKNTERKKRLQLFGASKNKNQFGEQNNNLRIETTNYTKIYTNESCSQDHSHNKIDVSLISKGEQYSASQKKATVLNLFSAKKQTKQRSRYLNIRPPTIYLYSNSGKKNRKRGGISVYSPSKSLESKKSRDQ